MFCYHCGAEVLPEDSFCCECGTDLRIRNSKPQAANVTNEYVADNVQQISSQGEQVLMEGKCNWVINPLMIQNGSAVLTNKRFIYKKGIINTVITSVGTKIATGSKEFEVELKDIKGIRPGRQGIMRTIVLTTVQGREYNCVFYKFDEFWAAFNKVLDIHG